MATTPSMVSPLGHHKFRTNLSIFFIGLGEGYGDRVLRLLHVLGIPLTSQKIGSVGVLVRGYFSSLLCVFLEGPTLDPFALSQSKCICSFCRTMSLPLDSRNIPGTFGVQVRGKLIELRLEHKNQPPTQHHRGRGGPTPPPSTTFHLAIRLDASDKLQLLWLGETENY